MKNTPRIASKSKPGLLAQKTTLKRIVSYWCVYHVVFWHVLFLYWVLEHRRGLPAGGQTQSFLELYTDFSVKQVWILVCAAGILPFLVWDAVRLSHRMVGPLARFRHCLKLLSEGECVTQIKIRERDFLVDLQNALNEFLDSPYNTRRWGAVPPSGSAEASTVTAGAPQDEGEMALESLHEIQASLWESRQPCPQPEPVAMTPRDVGRP